MVKNEQPLKSKFLVFSIMLFLVILIAGSTAFILSIRQIIRENKEIEMSQMLEVERIRLETSVNSEIAIALKLANSPLIKRYFTNPGDAGLEKDAFEEIASYRRAFLSNTIFWMNDKDRIFYSDDLKSYWVDTEDPDNYWYNMTLYDTEVYNFNINYNPDLNMTKLWINAPVFNDNGVPLGMVGTGIDLSYFIDSIYANFDERIELYFFNSNGEITGARDVGLVEKKKQIKDVLSDMNADIFNGAAGLAPGEVKTYRVSNGEIAINTIPVLDWYSVAFIADSISDYDTALTALFLAMLLLILVIIIIFNVFVDRFLNSLRQTAESLVSAQNEAEAANESKSTFMTTLSREIRMPLGETIGEIELRMLRSDLTADMSSWLRHLLKAQNAIRNKLDSILEDKAEQSESGTMRRFFETADTRRTEASKTSKPGETRHLFVINPKSFITLKDLKDFLLSIEKCFSVGYRAEYKVYISRYPRDAYSAVHRYLSATPADEIARIYAVGGDGILFDCLNGLAKFSNAELAPIPYGNANDFVRAFGADNMELFRDIKLMSKAPSRPVDAILCGQHYALGCCSIGIEASATQVFANTIERINSGKTRGFVPALYNLGAVQALFDGSENNMSYRLTFDGEDLSGDYLFISVGNTALNGGNNIPNPFAVPDDGILDVITCKPSAPMRALRMLPAYTSGQFCKYPDYLQHRRLKEMHCESDKLMSVILDGETYYTRELDIKVLPKAVKIVSPNGIDFADYSSAARGAAK